MTDTRIQFATGWNCCKANPAKVIVWSCGSRWAVCKPCASRFIGEVQELPAEWIAGTRLMDATNAGIEAIEFVADVVTIKTMRFRRDNGQRGHVETHAVAIAERPTNAKTRREHAIAVFVYKWLDNPEFSLLAAMIDLDTMAAMGRTPRWKASVLDWKNNLMHADDRNYVISQYAVFANYAA